MAFDGVDDYVEADDSTDLDITSELTLAARINHKSFTTNYPIYINKGSDIYRIGTNGNTGEIYFRLKVGGVSKVVTTTTVLDLDKEYDVVGTYDGAIMKVYINGVLDATTLAVMGSIDTDSSPLRISRNSRAGGYFDGEMYDAKIYNYAFTAQQAKNYHNSFIKPTLIETFKDSGADGIVKTPRGWIDGTGSYSITEVDYDI